MRHLHHQMTIVRTLNYIGISNYQMDMKNVFLHGDLTEHIYMTSSQHILFSSKGVCKFKRSSYGLK